MKRVIYSSIAGEEYITLNFNNDVNVNFSDFMSMVYKYTDFRFNQKLEDDVYNYINEKCYDFEEMSLEDIKFDRVRTYITYYLDADIHKFAEDCANIFYNPWITE